MLTRACSLLEIKSFDTDRRTFSGVASSPVPDRVGDVVLPSGARFAKEIPLLLHHDATLPVGHARLRANKDAITFEAQLPDPATVGSATLRDRIEEAWASVKAGLLKGVSIGFRAAEDGVERIKSGGLKFTDFEILELSLVAVPAHQDATIVSIKSISAAHLAATGHGGSSHTSGVSDLRVAKATPKASMKTLAEKKAAFVAEKEAKVAKMNELIGGTDGTTLEPEAQETFDTLEAEVKAIDKDLSRIETMETINKATVKPVDGTSAEKASVTRTGSPVVTVRETVPAGIGFARAVMCQLHARLDGHNVLDVAKARYPSHESLHHYLAVKATVPAGTTTQAVYAAPLVYASNLASEFIEFLQPQTILGKFGTGGVPGLTRVPFNVRVPSQIGEGFADWVGEGKGKPVTSAAFGSLSLAYAKVATIAVLTKELVRLSTPSAETLVRNMLSKAIVRKLDDSFIDPSFSAVAGVHPASITNGVSPLTSAGTSADNARTDIGRIMNSYLAVNDDPSGLVFIMPPSLAVVLSLMRNSLGQKEFSDINANGGTLEGFPVITSQHAANSSGAGNLVIAVKASDIFLADDGNVTIDASQEASVQMSDAPTLDATAGTGASLVSLWQTNSVGLRAEREITWAKARSTAVVYMDDVNWGSVGSPA